jgi:hypothetical protein
VSIVAWQVLVTAGRGLRHGLAENPDERESALSRGACSSSPGVSPTTLMMQIFVN